MKTTKNHYRLAVQKGFKGTFEDYQKDLIKKDKVWGRSQKRIDGKFIYYDKCIKCGTKGKKHYLKGLCVRCFEISRRAYKLEHYHANADRRNKLSEQKSELRNS